MSESTNEINKITINSPLELSYVNMTTLLFTDGKISPKAHYTISDNMLFLKNQAQTNVDLFQFVDSSKYFEFLVNLTSTNTTVSGADRYGNKLSGLSNTVIVFVNGYKLSSSEYTLNTETNVLTIKSAFTEKQISTVIVYTSEDAVYEGNVIDDFSWDSNLNQFVLKDYTIERYIFFKNGELLSPNKIQKVGNNVRLNTTIRPLLDVVEYYRMSKDCYTLTFTPEIGYLTYGPKDDRGTTIQNPYDCVVTFDNIARLVIDDIRTGFFIHEENADGCVMIVDDDFEKCSLKCLIVKDFSETSFAADEYYLTVPDAPSILKYVSQYDLNGTLFKELLVSFQKVLLNETYDTIKRLGNIRNINKVDSSNISALINFLGLNINVTNLTLEKKHNLIEELRTFYNVVGTRASYNFYNAFEVNGKVLNIQQLFTPIKSTDSEETVETFFPSSWGKLNTINQTLSQNETRTDYDYIWSMHFDNGVLPVVLTKDSVYPKYDFTKFETVSDTQTNSGVYDLKNSTWLNSVASSDTNNMYWKHIRNNISYTSTLPLSEKTIANWWKWSAVTKSFTSTSYKNYTYNNSTYDIPYIYGTLTSGTCTVTQSEDRTDWVYILSLHFQNGTLPIKVYHYDNSFDLNLDYFTSDTSSTLNSMVYTGNRWMNSVAADKTSEEYMVWYDESNTQRRSLDFTSATAMNWNDGNNTVFSSVLTYVLNNGIISIYKSGTLIGTIKTATSPLSYQSIFVIDETAGSTVYDLERNAIGTMTSCDGKKCLFNGYNYTRTSSDDLTYQLCTDTVTFKYTQGQSVAGGVCYDDQESHNPISYTNPTGETFKINDLTYSVFAKGTTEEDTKTINSFQTTRFSFTIKDGLFTAEDLQTGTSIGSWTFTSSEESSSSSTTTDTVKRYVTFKTAEELGAAYKEKYITDSTDFGQVSELSVDGGVNLSNTPRYEGVLRYSNYPVLLKGKLDRYHYVDSELVTKEDTITLSLIVNSIVSTAKISEDNNYECEINESTNQIVLKKYLGTNSKVIVPETLTYENKKIAQLSATPNNLTINLYDSNDKKVRLYDYDETTYTFKYLLEDDEEYYYKLLDKNKNVLFTHDLEDGDKTISTILPLVNDYTTNPQVGPNTAAIDCGQITGTPIDFYDFGSVSEQIDGHWVSWYEWNRSKNWYPTNHVDVSVEIPFSMDYETFMYAFKDTFYAIASAVLYIHQITQIYMFGDPNNAGLTEVQPMSLLTTQPYETEEQAFTNDHEFQPYKMAVSNPPLNFKSYLWKEPKYEFINNTTLKVSVDLYKNYGRDEYIYKTTGVEKDLEWTETLVGYFPCTQLNYTYWAREQDEAEQTTGNASYKTVKTIPTYTVTCTPNQNRTDWLYCLVINYDSKEEGYLISKDLQTVQKIITSSEIKKLQTIINGEVAYVRPNSMFYENGAWCLGYVTTNYEFDTFEWKLATLPKNNPEDYKEEDDDGIAQFPFYNAALMNWNLGRSEQVIVGSKSEVENDKLQITIDTREDLYEKINQDFDVDEATYQEDYSYTKNNATWSCKLKKYNISNSVELSDETLTNDTTILLPTSIVYSDSNTMLTKEKPLSCDFSKLFGDINYTFTKLNSTLEEEEEESGEEEVKVFWKYTNYLSSSIDNSQFTFNTYGSLLTRREIVITEPDYVVLKYRWNAGKDLDSWTYITNAIGSMASSFNNVKVGWSQNTYVPASSGTKTWYNWRGGFPYVNARAVGSLTITSDFVVSGFSTSSSGGYLQIFQNLFDDANTWEIKLKFTTGTDISTNQKLLHACVSHYSNYGLAIYIASNHFGIMGSSNGSSWLFNETGSYTVLADTTYYLKATFDGTKYTLSYSLDDETYTDDVTYTSSTKLYSTLPHVWLGLYGGYEVYNNFLGSMDLKECYAKANNTIVWKGVDTLHVTTNVTNHRVTILPNGLASGFSTSAGGSYVQCPTAINYSQDFELVLKVFLTYTNTCIIGNNTNNASGGGIILRTAGSNRLRLWGTSDDSSWEVTEFDTGIDTTLGTQYIKLTHSNSQYIVSSSIDGTNWTTGNALSSTGFTSCLSTLGSSGSSGTLEIKGSMDLKECYMKVGNTVTWQGATINENYLNNATPVIGNSLYSAPNVLAEGLMANVIGSPTVSSDYAVSGFSTTNYLATNSFTLQTGDTLILKIKTPSRWTSNLLIWACGDSNIILHAGSRFGFNDASGYHQSELAVSSLTDYYLKLEIGETSNTFSASTNGTSWTSVSFTKNSTFAQTNYFGINTTQTSYYTGSVYMSDCSVTRDGSTIWSGVGPLTVSSVSSNVITATNGSTYDRNSTGDITTSTPPLLWWGGDNTGTGEENILMNIKNMKDYYLEYMPALLNVEMYACWYSTISETQPTIEVTAYKGGTMSKSGYQFINTGGTQTAQKTIQAQNMSTTTTHEYRSVANVKYNKATNTFTLSITPRQ